MKQQGEMHEYESSKSFISHTVQMKHASEYLAPSLRMLFISHTVQMKHWQRSSRNRIRLTLYPTRFRWNVYYKVFFLIVIILYIPHGSDETLLLISSSKITLDFISHTVQMKQKLPYDTNLLNLLLYIPHGSDETLSKLCITHRLPALYPTRFRWNKGLLMKTQCLKRELYIPHGSDETVSSKRSPRCLRNFISHTVQMKLVHQAFLSVLMAVILYIPHGSDETLTGLLVAPFNYWTLYPTRFRWNLKYLTYIWCFIINLYIPHGSDETI